MIPTVYWIIAILALLIAVWSAYRHEPPTLWISVVLLAILEILHDLPR